MRPFIRLQTAAWSDSSTAHLPNSNTDRLETVLRITIIMLTESPRCWRGVRLKAQSD
jgi:hypothetical protein